MTRVSTYKALIYSTNYTPFGVVLEEREFSSSAYRYTFQNQEHDDELKGEGNSINFTYRMHDPRLGRFFAVDPLYAKFAYNSSFAFCENRVIDSYDFEGLEAVRCFNHKQSYGKRHAKQVKFYDVVPPDYRYVAKEILEKNSNIKYDQIKEIQVLDNYADFVYKRSVVYLFSPSTIYNGSDNSSYTPSSGLNNVDKTNVAFEFSYNIPAGEIVNYKLNEIHSSHSQIGAYGGNMKVDFNIPEKINGTMEVTFGDEVFSDVSVSTSDIEDPNMRVVSFIRFSTKKTKGGYNNVDKSMYYIYFENNSNEGNGGSWVFRIGFENKEDYVRYLNVLREKHGGSGVPSESEIE